MIMNTLMQKIGHSTLTLESIAPSMSASFSPNLYKYLKKKGIFYSNGGLLQSVYVVQPDTKAAKWFGAGSLMLGYWDEDFFVGTQLMSILCMGTKAESAAHACGNGMTILEGFWDNYLKIGRCAIDPDHQEHFMSDRFQENEGGRECLWCGHQQRKVAISRVVHDTIWKTK